MRRPGYVGWYLEITTRFRLRFCRHSLAPQEWGWGAIEGANPCGDLRRRMLVRCYRFGPVGVEWDLGPMGPHEYEYQVRVSVKESFEGVFTNE